MVTVYTKQELAKAIESKTPQILCKGEVAKDFINKKKRKTFAKIAGAAMVVGGIAALPFTGGASAAGIVAGAGLTVGTVVISTTELAIICGTILGLAGILTGAKVTFNTDGSVIVEPQYKS